MEVLILAGTVTRDGQLRKTQAGESVFSFPMVVDQGKDSNGEKRPGKFFDATIWGKRGEALARYITKGSKLTVTGRPTVRVHEGKAYLGVSVNEVTLMGGGQAREERRDDDRGYQPSGGGRGSSALDDEIPF